MANPLKLDDASTQTPAQGGSVERYNDLISADVAAEDNGLWHRINRVAASVATDADNIARGLPVEANAQYA
ncbi:hypothetical protein [Pseudomonas phage PA1C]|uniref:Uncharacterized protein n=1 Tax=Pseudomonas phage vB_PaeM_PS119XW TaxID=2601632 RepID=A0A5C1K8C3_9CAUD|nr:hypothetical protein PP933_gp012 [Pseudomonas phage vB_PaeM_PS119XW]QBX32160.1 hypothetical protein [Pseudomonas phage PA1C]QEM41741.1 hypothetical protein [Pseudomonas phage vB_PaeM_PS119XW]BEG72652.1 hypothetical protein RVBP21_2800 [Pseudomonas phage BRkr]